MPGRTREMTSHVMLSNGAAYILDCGMGVTNQDSPAPASRLARYARFSSPTTTPTTISNTARCWSSAGSSAWKQSVKAYGPPPLKAMTEDFLRAYKTTIDFWAEDFKMMPLGAIDVTEVSGAGAVACRTTT